MAPPAVSIVIPLYNGARFIGETLRSVLAQTFQAFEVIVVDDGSEDNGPDIVRRTHAVDARVQLVELPHLGVAEARNAGAARMVDSSRYLLFLDADDLWHPTALESMVEALERRPDAAGAFVLAEYVDDDGEVLHPGDFPRHMRGREDLQEGRLVPRESAADVRFEHLFLSNLIYPPSCLLLRRSAYDATGGFDGQFLAEDWDFVARVARRGPFVPVDRVLAGYRRHADNASGNRSRNVRGARQMWAALYHDARGAERKHLRGIWRAHQLRTASMKFAEGRTLIARGETLPGMRRSADALAHAILHHPPRFWITQGAKLRAQESGSAATLAEGSDT